MIKGRATTAVLGLLWATFPVLLLACGEIGGAGQCNGVEDSGVCVTVVGIQPFDQVQDTTDVDAYQTADCDGDPNSSDPEEFFKHQATVTISADLLPNLTIPPAPEFITITDYTIEYVPGASNLVFAPSLSPQVFGQTIRVDVNGSTSADLEFVPIQTKLQYVELGGDQRPAIYTVIYTFQGKTQFNKSFVVKGSTTANFGNFDNC